MPNIFRNTLDKYGELPLLDGLFLGWEQTSPPYRSYFVASNEDSIAILGPPRVGKTSGILIPQAMTWVGSLISASTKPDVLRATRGRRLEIAARWQGDVYVYAPTELQNEIDSVRTIHWSPASGCQDPVVCEQRVQKMLGPENPKDDPFFRQAAMTVLRAYFHAAALQGLGMSEVKFWLDTMSVDEADNILRNHSDHSPSAIAFADALRGIRLQPPETKSGTFGTVSLTLRAITSSAAVLANCEHHDFDIDRFLLSGSSLYIISPEATQTIIAPLVAGLIEAIVSRAYILAAHRQGDRLNPGLLLLLDEVGAIAPLPSLPQIMAQGASQGVLCVWASQTIKQLRARWGEEWAGAIWGASSQKLIFGGLADAELLEQTSQLFGEYDRYVSARGNVVLDMLAAFSGSSSPPHLKSEKHLPVKQIYNLPPGTACLIASTQAGPQPTIIGAPPAGLTPPFAQHIQAEADIQKTLKTRPGLTPDDLREQAIANALFQNMPEVEQRRFRNEEAALAERITGYYHLPSEKQSAQLAADPAFAREIQAQRTLAAQSARQQIDFKRKLFAMYSQGRAPHFTYTVVEHKSPARHPSLERTPQPYRMVPRPPSPRDTTK